MTLFFSVRKKRMGQPEDVLPTPQEEVYKSRLDHTAAKPTSGAPKSAPKDEAKEESEVESSDESEGESDED